MLKLDYAYCTGYKCPLAHSCWRYEPDAFSRVGELRWTSSQYDAERDCCPLYDPVDSIDRVVQSFWKRNK